MSSDALRLTFHGAAGTVTGSKHLLQVGDTRVLLDAGLFQGRKQLRLRNWAEPSFDPASVDHLLLSHTHIDHVGYLPRLVKLGLSAPVYCTPAAYELAELMLMDSAKIQEEDARHANRKGYSKHKPALPLYTREDAQAALDLRQRLDFDEWLELGPLRARFLNAGHILGSAFIEIRVPRGERAQGKDEVRIVYSGDVGRYDAPLHVDPEPCPPCDVLIMESTYGDRLHTSTSILKQIETPFRETLAGGGTILIPAFAVGRSQQITLVLRRLMKAGRLPEVPIHIDSPMAIKATSIYSSHLNADNVDADVFEDGRLRLFPEDVHFHRSTDESKDLNRLDGPRIIVSASGMLTGGRVLHHVKRLAGDPKNLITLVGYQAHGTRARALVEGHRAVRIHGSQVPVRCPVLSLHGMSGHADRDGLLKWADGGEHPPALVFLVHGDPGPAAALARKMREETSARTITPSLDETFDLTELLS
ncbi:MAG: MBL fold metallo-hydrolase [Acidobacteriota bacterium]